ncbi:GAF domain-containing protein [Maribellus comscasis]|uniref:GAF domain-containing protein n=1 Tax=Maribellus comscasis TaxID=2681766 RepID=A0A6I6K644_9BACT|nr:GAF domain-containing protein [Maribellus comscasis]QGY45474.1 GAF domain-containing protein [Maribellus comscasis]
MEDQKKDGRYSRIYKQLGGLVLKSNNTSARMATVIAVLHHKMDTFFWTGFYLLADGQMTVNMYQGPVACQVLEKDKGVCWAAFNKKETVIVKDVHQFPGHIACDSRSKSEIVVPFKNKEGEITGVLDIDSKELASFNEIDAHWLEKIVELIYQ